MTKIHLQSKYSDIVSDAGLDPRNEYEKMAERHTKALVESMKQTISETREKVRKPLTDAEIYECYRAEFDIMLTDSGAQNTIKKFARAIERAHGIGVEDE